MTLPTFNRLSSLFSFFFALCLALGCGGGTRGSGGQLFDGIVSDPTSRVLSNVSVTILATGDSATTDQNGQFSIATEGVEGRIEFLVEGSAFSGRVITDDIPQDASRVFVRFIVGEGPRPSISSDVEVTERRPNPEPTAKPRPTSTRSPTPESTPQVAPTITPAGDRGDDGSGNSGSGSSSSSGGSGASGGTGPSGGSGGSDDDSSDDDSPDGGSGPSDDDDGGDDNSGEGPSNPKEGEGIDAEGAIVSITGSSVTVQREIFLVVSSSELRGKRGERLSISDFRVGDSVKAKGIVRGGVVELERLEKE